ETRPLSDTTGAFIARSVPLAPGTTTTITATAQNAAGATATATVDVQNAAGPAISIALPAVNTYFAANAPAPSVSSTIARDLCSNPIDRNTAGGMSLADDGGNAIIGDKFVDNDAVTFASQVPLAPGRHYTLTISQALKDLGGNALASPYTLGFTTGTTAPAVK